MEDVKRLFWLEFQWHASVLYWITYWSEYNHNNYTSGMDHGFLRIVRYIDCHWSTDISAVQLCLVSYLQQMTRLYGLGFVMPLLTEVRYRCTGNIQQWSSLPWITNVGLHLTFWTLPTWQSCDVLIHWNLYQFVYRLKQNHDTNWCIVAALFPTISLGLGMRLL